MSSDLPQTIGIDISKAALDCHVHPTGSDRQFPNKGKGHKALIAWAEQWEIERIAYEATGTYHRALEIALASALRQAQPGAGEALCPSDRYACENRSHRCQIARSHGGRTPTAGQTCPQPATEPAG